MIGVSWRAICARKYFSRFLKKGDNFLGKTRGRVSAGMGLIKERSCAKETDDSSECCVMQLSPRHRDAERSRKGSNPVPRLSRTCSLCGSRGLNSGKDFSFRVWTTPQRLRSRPSKTGSKPHSEQDKGTCVVFGSNRGTQLRPPLLCYSGAYEDSDSDGDISAGSRRARLLCAGAC